MNLPDDYDLGVDFDALRDEDRARVPAFRAMWERAESRARTAARRRAMSWIGIALAAGIVLAVGRVLLAPPEMERDIGGLSAAPPGVRTTAEISAWASPTASLLRTSGSELFAPATIHSSLLANGASASPPRGH